MTVRDSQFHRIALAAACAGLLAGGNLPEAAAQAGPRQGAWGTMPAPADSVTAVFPQKPMPLWEACLVWPYRIVTFPIRLFYEGFHHVFLWGDGAVRSLGLAFAGPGLPIDISPSLGYGTGGGFGGGLVFGSGRLLSPGNEMELRAEASTRDERRLTLGYRHDGRTPWQFGAGHRLEPYSRFYGLGPRSRQEDESYYTLELNWIGASHSRRVFERLVLTGELLYTSVGARHPGVKETPPLGEVFPDPPVGFGGTSDGMSLGLTLERGTLGEAGRPERGSFRRAKVTRFEDFEGDHPSYWQFRFEAQEFVPLWFDRRALAFRGMLSWIDTAGHESASFPRLNTNDEPDLFRGYQDFRFRDDAVVLGTLEYRWPIWTFRDRGGAGLDAYVFTDVGQVFGEFDEMALRDLTWSYGFGFRLLGKRDFLTRIEFAWSEEGSQIRFSGNQVFQFARGDLYHGRNPVPYR